MTQYRFTGCCGEATDNGYVRHEHSYGSGECQEKGCECYSIETECCGKQFCDRSCQYDFDDDYEFEY